MRSHDHEYGDTGHCVHCGSAAPEIAAFERSANWLARANELKEKGKLKEAERCYEKSAHWLHQYNVLIGDT